MRRSLLFIPGNNPGMLSNCDVFESDTVIIDLEDAVSSTEKDSARNLVTSYINTHKIKNEIMIRINGFDTPFYQDDLSSIVSDNIDSIMLPKARIDDVKKLDEILSKFEKERKMKKHIAIVPIIEAAISLIEVDVIASLSRVNGILLGAEDFTKDLEVKRTKEGKEILYARSRIIVACKAYKIDAIDTPFTDTLDMDGLVKDVNYVKELGMNAKSAIHPNQIEAINNAFTPTKQEIEYAQRVLIARDEAFSKGLGVFSLDGKMVDAPVIARAETVIKKATKFGVL